LNTGTFPQIFKHAVINPVYKGKGSRSEPLSYRPISTLPFFAKLFEKNIARRISEKVESHLSDNQHGFRSKRSCFTALTSLTHKATLALDNKKRFVGATFVDLKRAFDFVEPDKLLYVFKTKYLLDANYIALLYDYARDRSFTVLVNNEVSKPFHYNSICPQGSTVAPLLFSLYFDGIKDVLDIDYLLFADDLVLFTDSQDLSLVIQLLTNNLCKLNNWCLNYGMHINYNKTKWMLFHRTNVELTTTITVDNNYIERVTEFKYLGLWLDEKLSFIKHYEHVKSKIAAAIGGLNKLIRFLTPPLFKCLIKSMIYSIKDYALPIWGSIRP